MILLHEHWWDSSHQNPSMYDAPRPAIASMKQLSKYLANVEVTSLLALLACLRSMEDIQIFGSASALLLEQAWCSYDAMKRVAARFPL